MSYPSFAPDSVGSPTRASLPSGDADGLPGPGRVSSGALLVDGHAHFHDCFEVGAFLDGAVRNFREGAWDLGIEPELEGCLLFGDGAGDGFVERLRSADLALPEGRWAIHETGEVSSLVAEREDGARLVLVAGRQVVTKEGLEVLALACGHEIEDGRPLLATLSAVERAGAVPVLPWGVGKWIFQRGELVASVLADGHPVPLFLGDNSGRLHFAPLPPLFRAGAERGIRVLPGSDPLPMSWQERNAGRYGFVLEEVAAAEAPAESVVRGLLESEAQPRFFGRREGIGSFLRAQLTLQWRARGRRSAPNGRDSRGAAPGGGERWG